MPRAVARSAITSTNSAGASGSSACHCSYSSRAAAPTGHAGLCLTSSTRACCCSARSNAARSCRTCSGITPSSGTRRHSSIRAAMPTRTQLVLVLAIAAAACKGGAPAQPAPPPLECTLALLKTGPRTEPLTDDERKQIFGGHFANMMRLATEGLLLVAGPYGKVKTDPALRGLFIFDTNDPARARQIAETDPGFQAGVFQFELHALSTHARLREQMAAELAATDPNAAPGASIRGYVLLTADDGTRAMH